GRGRASLGNHALYRLGAAELAMSGDLARWTSHRRRLHRSACRQATTTPTSKATRRRLLRRSAPRDSCIPGGNLLIIAVLPFISGDHHAPCPCRPLATCLHPLSRRRFRRHGEDRPAQPRSPGG